MPGAGILSGDGASIGEISPVVEMTGTIGLFLLKTPLRSFDTSPSCKGGDRGG